MEEKGDEVAAVSSFKENASEQKDNADHLTILSILLHNPEEMDLKRKPSAIRENKLFSLDMQEIPIPSAKADENGAHVSNGSVKQYYTYNASGSSTSPACTNAASTIPTFSGQLSACEHVRRRIQSHTTSLFIAGPRKVLGLKTLFYHDMATQHVQQQVRTIGKIQSYLQKSMASWRRECRQTRFTVLLQTEKRIL